MTKRILFKFCSFIIVLVGLQNSIIMAETVGVFYNSDIQQVKFAANDVKIALESKGFKVEMLSLTSLNTSYVNKKIIIDLLSNAYITGILIKQGGTLPTALGEQAYGLVTTTTPQTSYWVLGGDNNGAMYGGLQIAENISFNAFSRTYNNQEAPSILKRGIKLNYPLDKLSSTYGGRSHPGFKGTSYSNAIPHIWDSTYWFTWFDEMARNRYNVVSVWLSHPFTCLIKMEDYPDVAIQNITGFDGYFKTMSIDEKIVFWKKVMAYAKARGFDFYIFNWNVFTFGATGKYGITEDADNPITRTYMNKCMKTLLETYPDLAGFGVTNGENKSNEDFLWETYGKALYDYAIENPQRNLNFIHRWHQTTLPAIKIRFAPLFTLPNVKFEMSYKYSIAHMYSAPKPGYIFKENIEQQLKDNEMKTWLTLRNDEIFYHHWGDPIFARTYVNGMLALGDSILKGFNMGSDGFCPTRTFFCKDSVSQNILEIQRQWYMYKLWGRLSYNPNTSDDVFKDHIKLKYPTVSSDNLFTAWSKASSSLPKVTELVHDTWYFDYHWWIEACNSIDQFRTAEDFTKCKAAIGSSLCDIENSANNNCNDKKSTYQLADEIENDALAALSILGGMTAQPNTELSVTLNNIRAMSYMSLYYAYKIRGATYLKAGAAQNSNKITSLGKAYCWWIRYTNLMDSMYTGMGMQRVVDLPDWHYYDKYVLKDYMDNGGSDNPLCNGKNINVFLSTNDPNRGSVKGAGTYKIGDNVTVVATPKAGYQFANWTDNNSIVSTNSSFKVNLSTDMNLFANFKSFNFCQVPWSDKGFTVNNTTVNKTYEPIDISCEPNGVTVRITLNGEKTDKLDYCKLYYKVDDGVEILMAEVTSNFVNFTDKTITVSDIIGKKLEIIIRSVNNKSDEFYYITDINVIGDIIYK